MQQQQQNLQIISNLPPHIDCVISSTVLNYKFTPNTPVQGVKNPNAPRLHDRQNYATVPPIEVLEMLSNDDLCKVRDFQVCHQIFGGIMFPGCTNLLNVDIDLCIKFANARFSVYENMLSPPIGEGFNKHAKIYLNNYNPQNKSAVDQCLSGFSSKLPGLAHAAFKINEKQLFLEVFYFFNVKK